MAGPTKKNTAKTIRPRFNIHPILDIMLGRYVRGVDGLWYLNGGFPQLIGVAGRGNTFKTALLNTIVSFASIRYKFEYTEFHDTELSLQSSRIQDFIDSYWKYYGPEGVPTPNIDDLLDDETTTWNMTASDQATLDEWWRDNNREPLADRMKIKEKDLRVTPFLEHDGSLAKLKNPWGYSVDSMSEGTVNLVENKYAKNDVGSTDLNTEAMDSARAKSQLMRQMPNVAAKGGFYYGMTAHADDELKMGQYEPSTKKLAGLKGNLKLKGVPGRAFTFLTNSCLLAIATTDGLNKKTKLLEYPMPDRDPKPGDTDLRIVTYMELRGKGGPTGAAANVAFSQRSGFIPEVTSYIYIHDDGNDWGINTSGNGGSIKELVFCPGEKFTRNNLRKIFTENRKMARALELTAEMIKMYNTDFTIDPTWLVEPEVVYDKMIELGFDWDKILTETVYFWYFEDQKKEYNKVTLTARTIIGLINGEYPTIPKCLKYLMKAA